MLEEKTIKIQVKKKTRMKQEVLNRWSIKIRHRVNPYSMKIIKRVKKLPKYINTKKKLAKWLLDKAGAGHYFIYGYRKGNQGGLYKLVQVRIKRKKGYFDESEPIFDYIYIGGISRFNFWKEKK